MLSNIPHHSNHFAVNFARGAYNCMKLYKTRQNVRELTVMESTGKHSCVRFALGTGFAPSRSLPKP